METLVVNSDILISVIIPLRNEEGFILHFDKVISQAESINCEFLFIDGMSDDLSAKEIMKLCKKYPNVFYLKNQKLYTPYALNLGLEKSRGVYICRMDCHSIYPDNYIKELHSSFEERNKYNNKIKNIGGVVTTNPKNNTAISKAISEAMASVFGVGNSVFRTTHKNYKGMRYIEVDTVPFGFYPKDVLVELGGFDDELLKNQDDNLNFRLLKRGYQIICDTSIKIEYYPEDSLFGVAKMFYKYGLYKPLSSFKSGVWTYRQFAPILFILYTLSFLALAILLEMEPHILLLFSIPVLTYLLLLFWFSSRTSGISIMLCKLLIYPFIHFSYGSGYAIGLLRLFVRVL